MKKFLISFLILITVFSSFGPSLYKSKILASETSSYQPVEANENSVIFENGDTIILSPQKRAPRGIIGSILIFVAGVLVGYIIDGVVPLNGLTVRLITSKIIQMPEPSI